MKKENQENPIIPKRINQARLSRSFSMQELASLADVSKQAISQFEKGTTPPSYQTLNKLSDILKYPVSFFYKPFPSDFSENSALYFRSRKTTRVKDYDAAREKSFIFREIDAYLSEYVDFPKVNFPQLTDYDDSPSIILDSETIEHYAAILRNTWKLGNGPIDNLTAVIQKNGISMSKFNLRIGKVDGFSAWYNGRPFIFSNDEKNTNGRVRFNIAHELGHLLMHADYFTDSDLKNSAIREKVETEADCFAAAFLLPKETFSRDVFSSSIDHFIQLKKKWKVSISCMINRCDTLGILSQNQIKYLKDQMTARMYWRKEPLDTEIPVEQPFAHKQAIMLLLDNNIVTPSKLVYDIGCNADEIEKYCFLDPGTLDCTADTNIITLRVRP